MVASGRAASARGGARRGRDTGLLFMGVAQCALNSHASENAPASDA